MASDAETGSVPEPGDILVISLVGYSAFLPVEEQRRLTNALAEIVRDTLRFRVAEVAGKVIYRVVDGGMLLVFWSDPEAPLECALQVSESVKGRSDMILRMGIHRGPVSHDVDLSGPEVLPISSVETARRVMECGDAGHILLSKRAAFGLAAIPRWNAHLFELGEHQLDGGENIALVNFWNGAAGNPVQPTRVKRAEEETAARIRKRIFWRRIAAIGATAAFISLIICGLLLYRRPVVVPPLELNTPPPKSVVLFPFADLSPAHDQGYFCDGISEEILDRLAKAKGLLVIGRDSSFEFHTYNQEAGEIARKLKVSTILSGKLSRDPKRIRLSAQLNAARDGSLLWAKTFEFETEELSEVENEIVRSVLQALQLPAPVPPQKVVSDPVAHDLYLQGLFLLRANRDEDLRTCLDFFRLALSKDAEMAPAWGGLARAWLNLAERKVPPLTVYPQVSAAAAKAVAIDSENVEAHLLEAEAKRVFEWDLKTAEKEVRRALQINPSSSEAHLQLSRLLASGGDPDQGLLEIKRAIELDPLSPATVSEEIKELVAADRLDDAFAEVKHLMDVDPNYAYFETNLALVYREQGKLREALEIYSRLDQSKGEPSAGLAITYALLHRVPEAQRVLERLILLANTRYFPAEEIGSVYVALGDRAKAFQWLNRAAEQRSVHLHQIATAREFRQLRGDQKFTELLWRIGIDPAKLHHSQGLR